MNIPVESKKIRKRSSTRQATLRRSNFFCTISTNTPITKLKPEEKDKLLEKFDLMMDTLFGQKTHKISDFLILTASKEAPIELKDVPLDERFVEPIQLEYVIEIGGEKLVPHGHASIFTSHRGLNVKLDFPKIWIWLEEYMGFKLYFNADIVRDPRVTLRDYMSKGYDQGLSKLKHL